MVLLDILVALIVIYVLMIFRNILTKNKNEPPGPFNYPIIGNLLQVALLDPKYPHIALNKMSKKYGEIFTVQFGMVKSVSVHGYNAIKKVLVNDDCNGRPDFHWLLDRTYGERLGLNFSNVEHWRECRRVTTRLLRDFGYGKKKSMEELVIEELDEFSKFLISSADSNNGVVQMEHIFSTHMLNNVWTMCSGVRIMSTDEKTRKLVRLMYDWAKYANYANNSMIGAFPFLSKWAPRVVSFQKIRDINTQMQHYLEGLIAEHRSRGTYHSNPQNFIEAYLKLIDEAKKNGNVGNVYTEKTLVSILYDFFLAASDTSSNTISFGILFLIQHPDVQDKVRAELDRVVGQNRWPSFEDKERLPYTEATLLEVLRMADVLPIGPRKLEQDTKFGDYIIEKDTTIMLNYHSICFDENTFKEPYEFRPERFLNQEGTKVINADKLLTFGTGKRNCIGEPIARMTIFIFLVGMIQKFTFEKIPGTQLPNSRFPISGMTNSPGRYEVMVKCRV